MAETLQITHYDLDGAVCAILCKYAIKTHGVAGYIQGKVERIPAVYEKIPEVIFNSIAVQKHNDEQVDMIITDLRISSADLAKTVESPFIRSLLYIDHHERDGEIGLQTIDYMDNKFDFAWMHGQYAAAALTLRYFVTKLGVKFPDSMFKLVKLTDAFDEWKKDSPLFPEAVLLNDLFWEYGFNDFCSEFGSGYNLTNKHRQDLERIEKEKDKYFEEAAENCAVLEYGKNKTCLVSMQPGGKWANEYTLRWDCNTYLILGKAKTGVITFSTRARDDKTQVNEIASQVASKFGGTGGGHYTAAGFYVSGDTALSDVVETFMETLENS